MPFPTSETESRVSGSRGPHHLQREGGAIDLFRIDVFLPLERVSIASRAAENPLANLPFHGKRKRRALSRSCAEGGWRPMITCVAKGVPWHVGRFVLGIPTAPQGPQAAQQKTERFKNAGEVKCTCKRFHRPACGCRVPERGGVHRTQEAVQPRATPSHQECSRTVCDGQPLRTHSR